MASPCRESSRGLPSRFLSSPALPDQRNYPPPTWSCLSPGRGLWGAGQAPFSQWGVLIGESNSRVPSASRKYNFFSNPVKICGGQLGFVTPLTLQPSGALSQMWELLWVFFIRFCFVSVGWFGSRTAFFISLFLWENAFSIPNRHTNELFKHGLFTMACNST